METRTTPDDASGKIALAEAARIAAQSRRRALAAAIGACHWQQPDAQQRHAMIAHVAYTLAERRGFAPGGELQDWLTAENEVNLWFECDQFSNE